MCPDCTRIEAENARLRKIKTVADKLVAALHIRYTGEPINLEKLVRKEINAYDEASNGNS